MVKFFHWGRGGGGGFIVKRNRGVKRVQSNRKTQKDDAPNLGPCCWLLRPSLVALVELVVLAVDSVGLGWRLRACTCTPDSTDTP